MTLEKSPAAVSAFEAYHKRLAAELAALKKKLPGVSDDDFDKLVAKLGSPEKLDAFAEQMPDQPTVAELITAFGGAEALGTFTSSAMGGNLGAMSALAEKGCKRDATALAAIAKQFESATETLGDMLTEGGLGGHPEAFAQVFAEGCGGDAAKLESFCKTFNSDADRASLRAVLDEGGLGQSPEALGALAQGDDGALLLKLAKEADKQELSEMLLNGGLGGQPPDRPDTLRSVLVDGLGGDPKRLKELHDAFPNANGDMPEMRAFLSAMNGKSTGGEAKAGKRMASVMAAFKDRNAALTPQQQAQKLYDPFFLGITSASAGSRVTKESGTQAVGGAAGAIAGRTPPPAGRMAEVITDAMAGGRASALLTQLTTDDADKTFLTDSLGRVDLAEAETESLRADTTDREADEAASEATQQAIEAAQQLTLAIGKKPDGGTPEDADRLTRAADACFAAARNEPKADQRSAAVDAADAAIKAAKQAIDRQAAIKLGELAGADAQRGALAAAGAMADRIKADPDATQAEKDAMKAAVDAAALALETRALADQAVDTGALSAAAKTTCAQALGKPADSQDVSDACARLKGEAEEAAKVAEGLTKALKAAPAPVDPALLTQAGQAAQRANSAAMATADETAMKAALKAARMLSDAVAEAAAAVAASAETSLAFAKPEAKAAVLAISDIGTARAALERDLAAAPVPGKAAIQTRIDELEEAARGAIRAALATAELARIAALDDKALKDAAEHEATRQAGLDGVTTGDAETAANDLAKQKGQAAKAAADNLSGRTAPVDAALIKAALDAAQAAAAAAPAATDKVQRDLALTEGKRAADLATSALAANAKHGMADRTATKKAAAVGTTNATRGSADTFAGDFNAGRAALGAALKTALNDIGEASSSQLAELASADAGVQDARAEAAKAAAAAGRPGASDLKKLQALKADAEAQQALAALAAARAGQAVTALATVPAPTWPPVLTGGATKFAKSGMPASPTEAELRDATVLCDAAIAANTRWTAAAADYRDAAQVMLKQAAKIPEAKRSAEEKTDYAAIEAMASPGSDAAGAPKMVKDASAALIGLETVTGELEEKAQKLMHAVQIARIDFTDPPGDQFDVANTTLDPADAGLENAAGFAAVIGTRAFKTVSQPDGSKPTFGPMDMDALIATGANLVKADLPGDFANPNPPPDRHLMGEAAPISGHADCQLNLKHMCERHCRSHFTYDPGELKAEEDILACAMLNGRIKGLNRDEAGNGRAGALFSSDENKVRRIGSGKTTTMWPEDISADDIAAAATLALVEIKKENPGPDTFAKFVHGKPKGQLSKVIPGIKVGSHTLKVSLGVSTSADTGPVRVVMFYPIGQDSLTVADCHKVRAAMGIS